MRWLVLTETPEDKAVCLACGQDLCAGDIVVVVDQGERVYVDRDLYLHRRHLDAMLAEAPTDREILAAEIVALEDVGAILA